jgi:hypothetical protein
MTCSERIEAIFKGEMVDQVPFVLKGWRVPSCRAERDLRNDGMGIMDACSVYRTRSPNVSTKTVQYSESGQALQRTIVETPVGEVTWVSRRMAAEKTEATTWLIEPPFKGPEDYKVLRFMAEDKVYEPAYEGFLKAQAQMDGDAFFKTTAPGMALHTIMYTFMDVEIFSIEWADHRDELIALHEAMAENQRDIYQIIAQSPAWVVQCGGNYASEVLGKQRFIDFVLPHWEDVCGILHEGDKLVGCHLDANNKLWAEEVGASDLDWIEAFSPAPDTDMTVADARVAWPGKTLFVNFPSGLHLESSEVIAQHTRQILKDAAPGDRFIVGITENVPENRWRESFRTILDTCRECGTLPIDVSRL